MSPPYNTLIVGLGVTGLACARYLAAKGESCSVTDSRPHPPELAALRSELPHIPYQVGGFDPALFASAQRILLSPGISRQEPLIAAALARGCEVIGDIELFARQATAPIVAITGSNGKSTVTTLVGEMANQQGLRTAVGGNLGRPALELLSHNPELYVLELSSFQLESTYRLRPQVAVVLNLSPDHLDHHRTLAAYIAAKASIYQHAKIRLFNRDDPQVAALQGEPRPTDRWFALGSPQHPDDYGLCHHAGSEWLCRGEQLWLPVAEVALSGRHQLANALAAVALAEAAGIAPPAILHALRSFAGLPHRSERIAEQHQVTWYNDSKGTNIGASIAALQGLRRSTGRTLLIAGGDGKGADFAPLGEVIAAEVGELILIGRDAERIAEALPPSFTAQHRAASLEQAVALAAQLARPGDQVLLSPACASFDRFRNYVERGDCYRQAVAEQLAVGGPSGRAGINSDNPPSSQESI